jgi:hypothetical protein
VAIFLPLWPGSVCLQPLLLLTVYYISRKRKAGARQFAPAFSLPRTGFEPARLKRHRPSTCRVCPFRHRGFSAIIPSPCHLSRRPGQIAPPHSRPTVPVWPAPTDLLPTDPVRRTGALHSTLCFLRQQLPVGCYLGTPSFIPSPCGVTHTHQEDHPDWQNHETGI